MHDVTNRFEKCHTVMVDILCVLTLLKAVLHIFFLLLNNCDRLYMRKETIGDLNEFFRMDRQFYVHTTLYAEYNGASFMKKY